MRRHLLSYPMWAGMGIATVMVLVLGVMALTSGSQVEAHQNPDACTSNGVGISFATLRSDQSTPIIGGATVQSGEQIFYRTRLTPTVDPADCSFGGGPLGEITITTPDGDTHTVVEPGDVPHIGGDGVSLFEAPLQEYTVSEDDLDGGLLQASTNYSNGISHTGGPTDFEQEGHDVAAASATRNLNFQDAALDVTKDATPEFTRTFGWDIAKSVDPDSHTLVTGDSGVSQYTVTVTGTGVTDSDHSVSGNITILNPAEFADAIIEGVDDAVNGTTATVDCGVTFPFNLAPGDTLECTYSAVGLAGDETLNTATVTTSGDVDGGEGTADVAFDEPTTLVNETINVDDTFAGDLGSCSAGEEECVFPYERTFTCDEDEGTHENTATIVETGQSADASVSVTCVAPAIDIRKQEEGPDSRTFPSGSDVDFEIVVTNTGTVDLTNVEVTDAEVPGCENSIGDLAVDDSVTYTCTSPDVSESFTNEACATGEGAGVTVEDCDPSTVEIVTPAIDIRKQEEGPDSRTFPSGSDVDFEIVVTNTGGVDLTNVEVTDAEVPGCENSIGDLAVDDSVTYTCTAPDVSESFTNEACATGEGAGITVEDCDSSTVEVEVVAFEGCTPGFWKQDQHFDSYPAPHTPDTLFSDVFGEEITVRAGGRDTITDPTLLEALNANGGGINALARHAAAALLNAASPDVSFGFTEAEVIQLVQDAIASGDLESAKDELEEQNEQGCPLS